MKLKSRTEVFAEWLIDNSALFVLVAVLWMVICLVREWGN